MKNPNGYGSVFKLSGNRRKPWAVRVTTGWNDDGKQQYAYLGYYESRRKAMMALAEYNNNPFDLSEGKLTFKEIYDRIVKEKWPDGPNDSQRSNFLGYQAAFNWAEQIHDKLFVDLRKRHLQKVIDDCNRAYGTKRKIRVLFREMYRYAMENDLVTRDYSQFVDIGPSEPMTKRTPFTNEEIQKLWDNTHRSEFTKVILMMIYTGLRPGEILEIETNNVFIEERYMRGGFKTIAGTNRVIPIHKRILPFVEERVNLGHKYLITRSNGQRMQYNNFRRDYFYPIMEELRMKHRPHDCRHTFATLMDNAGANKVSIKRIMGHASRSITDRVYTHKDIDELIKAIDKLE